MSFTDDLFIFEMANNHQGSVMHGKLIIDMCSHLALKYSLPKAAIKFQLRNLETFIHPDARGKDISYVTRFLSTELKANEFKELATYAKEKGLKTVATVFDEDSIPLFKEIDFDYLKIASCSHDDFPLLEKLSSLKKSTILSTGGASLEEINRAILTLKKAPSDLAILHCVGIYPTNDEELCLKQIEVLKNNFPEYTIGFSTHENPDSIFPISQCVSLGCQVFEKHVAVENEEVKKNAYSADATQLEIWLATYTLAKNILNNESRHVSRVKAKERESLSKLKRGVFKKGNKSFYAFPKNDDGKDVSSLHLSDLSGELKMIHQHFDKMTAILRTAGLTPVLSSKVTFSFQAGLNNYHEVGATYFDIYEDENFLKKWIVMAEGQTLPEHHHDDRDELLRVLYGNCEVTIGEKAAKSYSPGEYFSIKSEEVHSFKALGPVVLEEVVTKRMAHLGPSHYKDSSIVSEEKRKKIYSLEYGFLNEASS